MVTTGASWTGGQATALRIALRLTVDEFATRLDGLSPRGLAKWEHQPDVEASMDTQRDLDYLLRTATPDEQARFASLWGDQQ
ncbi:hypothetical protein GCM10009554_46630 [Kribbella koreensis]|uniref:XRE family transcriptional regulator n=1 Tax=Kribbella koreensis TaxID=57909 RepID=A0ABN1QX46_9ACTN